MCTPSPFCWGVELPAKFSKKGGGLTVSQFLEGGCWEKEGDLFQGDYCFYIKNKLKSEIFNDKKVFELKFFSAITKNLKWENLTKDLVPFKRWDGVKDEKF